MDEFDVASSVEVSEVIVKIEECSPEEEYYNSIEDPLGEEALSSALPFVGTTPNAGTSPPPPLGTLMIVPTPFEDAYDETEYQKEADEINGIIKEAESKPVVQKQVDIKFEASQSEDSQVQNNGGGIPQTLEKVEQIGLIKGPRPKLRKIRTAICTKCNTGFPTSDLYEHHMSTVHQDERPYACSHCKKRFSTLMNAKRHETIHDPNRFKGPPSHACDLCDKVYHLKVSLQAHRQKSHLGYKPPKRSHLPVKEHHSTNGVKNPKPYKRPKEIFSCTHCDLKFDMKCLLMKHMRCHTKERKWICPVCQHAYSSSLTLRVHIKNVHETEKTPSGMRHPRHKSETGKLCPCTVCDKVFKVPSLLRKHMAQHTGEKVECPQCGKQLAGSTGLRLHMISHRPKDTTGLRTFKCRVCGREGFKRFSTFRDHRMKSHKHIPYQKEEEKAFCCGVCGKPHFLRIRAIICALFAHDPSSLQVNVFKHKCPECPPEKFGFHNVAYLRRHWKAEHPNKFLPVPLRFGMYSDNLVEDALPSVVIDKKKSQEILENGIPAEVEKMDRGYPLFKELELFPIPEEERFLRRHPKDKNSRREPKNVECAICGIILRKHGLKRHLRVVHDPSKTTVTKSYNQFKCSVCEKIFRKLKTLREHEKSHALVVQKRRVGRPRKSADIMPEPIIIKEEPLDLDVDNDMTFDEESYPPTTQDFPPASSMFRCRFCQRKFIGLRGLRIHELRAHIKPWSSGKHKNVQPKVTSVVTRSSSSDPFDEHRDTANVNVKTNYPKNSRVNITDAEAVKLILNNKTVQINLFRMEI